MATVTTDFPTRSVPRSRAERLADGVVAGYIRALDGATARASDAVASAQPTLVAADALIGDAPINIIASRGHNHQTPRTVSAWSRNSRGGCFEQAKRLLEAR
jgi:hypothetical protein